MCRSNFGGGASSALDRAVHVTLSVEAGVLACEECVRTAGRATSGAPDRRTDRNTHIPPRDHGSPDQET